ncbi:MAG: UDP-2,3-diacylglucosamine diphosphatase [Phaeodactylibacter sp.]|nr:UDP-2,3-diacylglucosamine diphosphatase [Phaeodactylibacter sp.]MCB9272448.1 UDP-2,3-diacylglucosamine diphosphatase [Lewinellaceae bacterium]
MKKVYFASDFHLGVDARLSSREREQQIVRWLEQIRPDAAAIYLAGDVFDFWFEYRTVVPKGYLRLLGKLAELRDTGIPIYFFTGNHDMWMFRYFEEEMGIPTYRRPIERDILGKSFLIGHGDGLGPGDHGYKFIKRVFANPTCQWFFERLHPNFGIRLANFWSGKSRGATRPDGGRFLGAENEWLISYANRKLSQKHFDFFIFGHRHLPIDYTLNNGVSRYINLGDWLHYNSYAVFDGTRLEIQFFENENGTVFGKRETAEQKA